MNTCTDLAKKTIAERWERDDRFKQSCNEEPQNDFGIDFTREMAYDADEIARHEKELGAIRAVENSQPSHERMQKYDAPLVRSAQGAGSGTRRRVGTEEEARALAALKGHGKNKSKDHGVGNGKGETKTWKV